MARSANQKLKPMILSRYLQEQTDEDHPVTVPECITELERYGIMAERKSIYADMEALQGFGLDVQSRKGKNSGWFVGDRSF